ncbi:MAG: hypothetical protein RLZZ630_455 [Bacteroidota bacterium]
MKKHTLILVASLGMGFATLYSSCDNGSKDKAEAENCTPLNPNGDSERALLMREMTRLAEGNAEALRKGGDLLPYDGEFEKLASTTGTMTVDEDFFKAMSEGYLVHLRELYKAAPEDRIRIHNNLIQSCQDCHAQTCRGPLKRIDKMKVDI